MCSHWAQHIFLNPVPTCRRHRRCAHRLITGLLPGQHWMVAAERRVRSEGCDPEDFSRLADYNALLYVSPQTDDNLQTNLYWKLSALRLTQGCYWGFTNHVQQTSCRCKLWANATEMTCSVLTRFIVPCQPRIDRCHFTLRSPSDRNSNILGLLCY